MSTATANYPISVGARPAPPRTVSPRLRLTRLRLTRRGRRVLLALAVVPLIAAALAFALNGGAATATDDAVSLQYVSVAQGESLWQLAQEVAPSADPRDVIDDILTLNRLDSSQIVPGQRLAIPAQYSH